MLVNLSTEEGKKLFEKKEGRNREREGIPGEIGLVSMR